MGEFDGWYKYVRVEDVPEWEEKGWEVDAPARGCHHDAYSVVMRWLGDGDPGDVDLPVNSSTLLN
jgi:hypothetical protein